MKKDYKKVADKLALALRAQAIWEAKPDELNCWCASDKAGLPCFNSAACVKAKSALKLYNMTAKSQ